MVGIKGLRGVGKTTLLLQHLKYQVKKNGLYVTADHPWFYDHTLLNLADEFEKNGGFSLKPPFGSNLYSVLNNHKNLLNEIGQMLEPYGFDFVLDVQEQRFEIQKRVNRYVFKYPYISIADTFRRLIFHLAAIESNKNSVLILEEPEAHSYPPYIWQLANRIANDKNNQYFISTHSPYIIETLLQELKDFEINIWVTSFADYETKINPLPPEALQDMYDMGADTVFFNIDKFEKATL